MTHPVDNLVRIAPQPAELRIDAKGDGNTMVGYFTVFDEWAEIDSWWEGRFLERNAKGMLDATLEARAGQIKVLYDHGMDPQIGNKPLGKPDVLQSDAYYEVPLFRTSYNDDLKPGLEAGVYGASYRFRVTAESWFEPPRSNKHNPEKLPERTIEAVELYEFGPVTFPAYANASAGLRCGTDSFLERLLNDPTAVARLAERTNPHVVQKMIEQAQAGNVPNLHPAPTANGLEASRGRHPSVLRIRAAALATARKP